MDLRALSGVFLCALAVSAQTAQLAPHPYNSLELMKARQDLERLRSLVQAGAIAPAKLAEAEEAVGDAQDDEILRSTLYGSVTAQELTEAQAQGMVDAAQRRLDRQQAKLDRYQKLIEAGVLARGEQEPIQFELESRRLTLQLSKSPARSNRSPTWRTPRRSGWPGPTPRRIAASWRGSTVTARSARPI